MPFEIIRNDIIKMRVDAIVNAANSSLAAGGGVCGAIFQAAGYEQLDAACRSIGRCAVGQAVITAGFSLSAKYVIHAVGPIWQGGTQNEAALLESCYTSALQLAVENHWPLHRFSADFSRYFWLSKGRGTANCGVHHQQLCAEPRNPGLSGGSKPQCP